MRILDVVHVHRLVGGQRLAWHGRYHAHGPGEYEFHCFLEGQGSFLVGRTRHRIEGGGLFLVPPLEFHSILPGAVERPISYYAVLFSLDPESARDAPYLDLMNGTPADAGGALHLEPRERFLVEEVHHLHRSGSAGERRSAVCLLMSLVHRWFDREEDGERRSRSSRAGQHTAKALALMEASIRGRLGSGELARKLGLSTEHFIRRFRRDVGSSPSQYFTRMKIEGACALLAERGVPVARAAESFGFGNPFHFSRVFKKCTGLPPSEYRRIFAQPVTPPPGTGTSGARDIPDGQS